MARTKQTARRSTSGHAPRKQLTPVKRSIEASDAVADAILAWAQKGRTRAAKKMKSFYR